MPFPGYARRPMYKELEALTVLAETWTGCKPTHRQMAEATTSAVRKTIIVGDMNTKQFIVYSHQKA